MVTNDVRIVSMSSDCRNAHMACGAHAPSKPLGKCNNKELGNFGEDLASAFLESLDYEILERNWRSTFGEVDIVAEQNGTIVLVEVKTRIASSENTNVVPELAVNYRKRSKYQKLALLYLSLHSHVGTVRFDVIAVKLESSDDAYLRHYVGAYEWDM